MSPTSETRRAQMGWEPRLDWEEWRQAVSKLLPKYWDTYNYELRRAGWRALYLRGLTPEAALEQVRQGIYI